MTISKSCFREGSGDSLGAKRSGRKEKLQNLILVLRQAKK